MSSGRIGPAMRDYLLILDREARPVSILELIWLSGRWGHRRGWGYRPAYQLEEKQLADASYVPGWTVGSRKRCRALTLNDAGRRVVETLREKGYRPPQPPGTGRGKRKGPRQ